MLRRLRDVPRRLILVACVLVIILFVYLSYVDNTIRKLTRFDSRSNLNKITINTGHIRLKAQPTMRGDRSIAVNTGYMDASSSWIPNSMNAANTLAAKTQQKRRVNSALRLLERRLRHIRQNMSPSMEANEPALRRQTTAPNKLRPYSTEGVQVLIISTWRSGSSFLGALLGSHPLSVYMYEPIQNLIPDRIDGDEKAQLIKRLFQCDINSIKQQYPQFNEESLLTRPGTNIDVFLSCLRRPDACQHLEFITRACEMFPIRIIKVVRFRVQDVTSLMRTLSQLHVILLVRDPRAVVDSRDRVDWCVTECASTTALCKWLTRSLTAATRLHNIFPNRVLTIKYENLVSNVTAVTAKMLSFLGLQMYRRTANFIRQNTHTKSMRADQTLNTMSLTRNSTQLAYQWRCKISWKRARAVEQACVNVTGNSNVIELLGYETFSDERQLRNISMCTG